MGFRTSGVLGAEGGGAGGEALRDGYDDGDDHEVTTS